VKPADCGTAESGVYSARFRQVFGRALERPARGADANAQVQVHVRGSCRRPAKISDNSGVGVTESAARLKRFGT